MAAIGCTSLVRLLYLTIICVNAAVCTALDPVTVVLKGPTTSYAQLINAYVRDRGNPANRHRRFTSAVKFVLPEAHLVESKDGDFRLMMIQIDDYVDRNLTHDNISYNLGGQRPLTDVISDTAMVLRTFKLFGSDVRFSKGHPKELRAGFAVPRLRQLHPLVSAQCERSVLYCLKALSPLVWFKMATEYVTLLSGGGVRTEAPTVSDGPLDEFRQLMTGMYYLCWHTMKQAEELRFVTDRIGRDGGCDWHLGMGYPDTKHEKMRDFRGQTDFPRLRSDAFHCALHSFCPDVCCGRLDTAPSSVADCWQSAFNPCKNVADGTCALDLDRNNNLRHLMENRINHTCACTEKGYRWSMAAAACIDEDECLSMNSTCGEHEVCRNVIGSYRCQCEWGYTRNNTSAPCRRDTAVAEVLTPQDAAVKDEEISLDDLKAMDTKKLESVDGSTLMRMVNKIPVWGKAREVLRKSQQKIGLPSLSSLALPSLRANKLTSMLYTCLSMMIVAANAGCRYLT